ncbi:MAG: bifunctional diaminohydroxyphosphoribosylaminopyrimidine deaminase/5-amino-6-(5-phosphoribosylamino)uracil reductase RibD, partial [Pseudomonadota bacterium]
MRWAIALALEGMGRTSPNPMVGAVIVKSDRIVGEGYHRRAGTPHAEVHALRDAGRASRGAEMYVTLEPCAHEGRTPPCVPAIVEAGIRRVFVGSRDPNPLVDGRGIRALKKAGVAVVERVLEESCRELNEAYNKFIVSGVPFITAKVALSLDGKIATSSGDSRWITNEACRLYVHRLRGQVDAVMVGSGTVRRDDPRL